MIQLPWISDEARYRVQLSADMLLAAGFALDSVSATVEHREPGGTANVSVFQSEDRDYALQVSYALFPDRREITWNNLRLRFDITVWQTAHAGTLRWGQPGAFIDNLDLRSGADGRVFAHGLVPTTGAADLRVSSFPPSLHCSPTCAWTSRWRSNVIRGCAPPMRTWRSTATVISTFW